MRRSSPLRRFRDLNGCLPNDCQICDLNGPQLSPNRAMLHLIDLIDSPIRPIAILSMRVLGETKPTTDTVQTAPAQSGLTGEVLNGDAFDLIRKCAPESVDLLITSPPYWGLRTYDLEHNWSIEEDWKRA